jgi:hypothetical protein
MLPIQSDRHSHTYRHLARPWTHDKLGVRYAAATRRGEQLLSEAMHTAPDRPIALLATAIPSAATLSVAIHLVHALPEGARVRLAADLLDTAETNAGDALHRTHRALELDGLAHGYTADEWLPVIYDGAAPLLEFSRLDQEPPSLVRETQEAVRWLSSSIACLDEDRVRPPQPSPTRLLAYSSCTCSPMLPARAWSSGLRPAPSMRRLGMCRRCRVG